MSVCLTDWWSVFWLTHCLAEFHRLYKIKSPFGFETSMTSTFGFTRTRYAYVHASARDRNLLRTMRDGFRTTSASPEATAVAAVASARRSLLQQPLPRKIESASRRKVTPPTRGAGFSFNYGDSIYNTALTGHRSRTGTTETAAAACAGAKPAPITMTQRRRIHKFAKAKDGRKSKNWVCTRVGLVGLLDLDFGNSIPGKLSLFNYICLPRMLQGAKQRAASRPASSR